MPTPGRARTALTRRPCARRPGWDTEDPNTESGAECFDRQDNDGDGSSDCEDPDCAMMPPCRQGGRGGRGGGCNPASMAQSAASVTTTCCAGDGIDCSMGVPSDCTVRLLALPPPIMVA